MESFSADKSGLSGDDTKEKLVSSKDKGLIPLMTYYEDLITDYIISPLDDQFQFRWVGLDSEDADKRHELRLASLKYNEGRAEFGLEAVEGPLGDAPLSNPGLMSAWTAFNAPQPEQPEEEPDFGQPPPDDGEDAGEAAPAQEGADFGQKPDAAGGEVGADGKGADFGKSFAGDFGMPVFRIEP